MKEAGGTTTEKPHKRNNNPGAKPKSTGQRAKAEPNPDQTNKGEAGKAKEDRGGEGRAYRIRVAIVQLSGEQWGTRIIRMMNTSVW